MTLLSKPELLFRAQYYGQNVLTYDGKDFYPVDEHNMLCSPMYLHLRDISQLTDEELITVASIVCARHNRHYKTEQVSYEISKKRRFDVILKIDGKSKNIVQIDSDGVGFIDYWMGGAGSVNYYAPAQFAVTDYLRSIGICLPFTYLNDTNTPTTLSIDDLIGKGWVKIKE